MNRRSFLGRVLSVLVVGPLAKLLPKRQATVGMINSATYSFFRNQQTKGPAAAIESMNRLASMRNLMLDNPRRLGILTDISQ